MLPLMPRPRILTPEDIFQSPLHMQLVKTEAIFLPCNASCSLSSRILLSRGAEQQTRCSEATLSTNRLEIPPKVHQLQQNNGE